MQCLRKKYLDSLLNYNLIICLVTVLLFAQPLAVRAQTVVNYSEENNTINTPEEAEDIFDFSGDLLILEPVIQGFNFSDYAYVSQSNDKEYVALIQMELLQAQVHPGLMQNRYTHRSFHLNHEVHYMYNMFSSCHQNKDS